MTLAWLLFVAFIVIFVQGRMFDRFGLRRVTYTRSFSERACYEGEEVLLIERIANVKPLPLPWLRLESLMSASLRFPRQDNFDVHSGTLMQNQKSFFSLMPYSSVTRKHRIRATKRGCYDLSTMSLTCGDIFGMSKTTKTLRLDARLLVYPRLVPIGDIPLPSHSWQGDVTVRRWILDDPFIIQGAREYRYGDPLNAVNWKATARSGRLQVHQRDFTSDHRLMIYLNFELSEQMWSQVSDPELVEQGLRFAASLAADAIRRGIPTGFGCNSGTIDAPKEMVRVEPGSGASHTELLLDTMAKVVVDRTMAITTFLDEDLARGAERLDIVLITAYVSEEIQERIDRLEQTNNAVRIVPLVRSSEEEVRLDA
ncbi:DUF58 domain-containing protein [Paenibacillus koleovorans]|uniref:DUF58 domain-containing protein n=1 Tax=Paenibacillus koleovorans TaxID=121608 RepID=UPI000FD6EE82|nr:DUF58 domain-containing protein [Paenibacillus koleovorans]